MLAILNHHYATNALVALLLGGTALLSWLVWHNELWKQAFREVWRRRPLAVSVATLYAVIGLLDSVAWVGGTAGGEDRVLAYKPQTIVDRVLGERTEKSYSAPLARATLDGAEPLRHPGGHLLGTDILGRDVLHMTVKGVRVALVVGGLTSLLAIPLALLLGVSAGFHGRRVDDAVFFTISTLSSIPSLLLLIALIMALGKGTVQVCIALAITSWVGFARISRGETLKLRELDYVAAARLMGVSEWRIILRHIVPNLMHLVVITFVLMFSELVLTEAVLAWLGIGIDGSWGQMIAQAKNELSREPIIVWNVLSAFVAMFGLLLAVNSIGDAIRDVLDPRTLREGS